MNLGAAPTAADYVITTSPPAPGGSVTIPYEALGNAKGTYDIVARMTSNRLNGATTEVVTLIVR